METAEIARRIILFKGEGESEGERSQSGSSVPGEDGFWNLAPFAYTYAKYWPLRCSDFGFYYITILYFLISIRNSNILA